MSKTGKTIKSRARPERIPKVSEESMIRAIAGSFGIKTFIAQRAKINRATVDKYLAKMPIAQIAYTQERESSLDFAESELIKLIKTGDFRAIEYYLKTQGKKRGYTERQEVDVTSGGEKIRSISPYQFVDSDPEEKE